jgi:hypothetical protein
MHQCGKLAPDFGNKLMMHLKNFFAGALGLLSALGPRAYPLDGGYAEDRRNLRSDWARVGDGLRGSLKKQARQQRDQSANSR